MTNFKDQFKLPNIVRICSNCGEEHKIDSQKLSDVGWSASHGYCARHFRKLMKQLGLSDDVIQAKISKNEPLCADLDDGKNKPLLNWLLNPTPNKKETQ